MQPPNDTGRCRGTQPVEQWSGNGFSCPAGQPLADVTCRTTTMTHTSISVHPTQTGSIYLLRHMKYLGENNQLITTEKLPSWLLRSHSSVWLYYIFIAQQHGPVTTHSAVATIQHYPALLSSSSFSYWHFLNHPLFYISHVSLTLVPGNRNNVIFLIYI